MRNVLLGVTATLFLGCAEEPSIVHDRCAKEPPKMEDLSEVERKAFNHTLNATKDSCARDTQCQYTFFSVPDEISIFVEYIYQDENTGDCSQVPGGGDLNIYDEDGNFLRAGLVA